MILWLYLKRKIHQELSINRKRYLDITSIKYPTDFNNNYFNREVFKYLIKLLYTFNNDSDSNAVFIKYNNKKIIKCVFDENEYMWIMARGTATYNELEQDIKIYPTSIEDYKCHTGFYNIYIKIKDELLALLDYSIPKKIFCLGHSLGGGLVTLAAMDLFHRYKDIVSIYIIGTPRTCNERYNDFIIEKPLYNVINLSDIYVNIIPSIVPFYNYMYSHIGKLYVFDKNMYNIIDNHSIVTYYENIDKYVMI